MEKIYLDHEGYENYLKELENLREKIDKNSSDISEFMSDDAYGDGWHDNFAYEQAIKKESSLLFQLNEKKKGLAKIEIIDKKLNGNRVDLGSIVTVNIDGYEEMYKISGNTVSDLNSDIPEITLNSPLAKAIYKKQVNDNFSYTVDSNTIEGIIVNIK